MDGRDRPFEVSEFTEGWAPRKVYVLGSQPNPRPHPPRVPMPKPQTPRNRLTMRWRGNIVRIMRSDREHSVASTVALRELQVLEEVSHRPHVSQRQLADRLGVALGATNVLIRRLADQGYIQASKVGWRRWSYAITATGVTHKAFLAQGVVERFLHRYNSFRAAVRAELEEAGISKKSRVAVVGSEEMTELVYLALTDLGIDDIVFYAAQPPSAGASAKRKVLGRPMQHLDAIIGATESPEHGAVVVATAGNPADLVAWLKDNGVCEDRVVTLFSSRVGELTANSPDRDGF